MTLYNQIDEAIDSLRGEALALLQALVRIPSLEGDEKPCMDLLERHLRGMGLDVDRWIPDDDELAAHPAFVPTGMSYAERPNVVAVQRGAGGGRSLKFNGHVDVVPIGPAELWQHGPWSGEFSDGKVWGRGQRRYERRRRQQCALRHGSAKSRHPIEWRPHRRMRRR